MSFATAVSNRRHFANRNVTLLCRELHSRYCPKPLPCPLHPILAPAQAINQLGEWRQCKTVQLSNGPVALVDHEDYERVNQFTWFAKWDSHTKSFYAVHNTGKNNNWKLIRMHQFILGVYGSDLVVDHENHNTLDNQKKNLRVCTHEQNMRNKRVYSNNRSGVKGVYQNKNGSYKVSISVAGKQIHVGTYPTLVRATKARLEAEEKYHGEFAYKQGEVA